MNIHVVLIDDDNGSVVSLHKTAKAAKKAAATHILSVLDADDDNGDDYALCRSYMDRKDYDAIIEHWAWYVNEFFGGRGECLILKKTLT